MDIANVLYLCDSRFTELQGADVERVDQFSFYGIGKHFQKIIAMSGDVPRMDALWILFEADRTLKDWLAGDPRSCPVAWCRSGCFSAGLRSFLRLPGAAV